MTESKQLHHAEQMEALRRDFQKLWHGELLKRMQMLRVHITDYRDYVFAKPKPCKLM